MVFVCPLVTAAVCIRQSAIQICLYHKKLVGFLWLTNYETRQAYDKLEATHLIVPLGSTKQANQIELPLEAI